MTSPPPPPPPLPPAPLPQPQWPLDLMSCLIPYYIIIFLPFALMFFLCIFCVMRGQRNHQHHHHDESKNISATDVKYSGTVFEYGKERIDRSCCDDCVICLEDFDDGDECKVLDLCRHVYHRSCIDRWLVKDGHCPLCRGSVRGNHVDP